MEPKWINIIELDNNSHKTKLFLVTTKENSTPLGHIKWFSTWRKYGFYPLATTVFEADCLRDIMAFLNKLMLEKKLEQQNDNSRKK